MKWCEVVAAIANAARARQNNSAIARSGPQDAETIGHARGAQWTFGVIADELDYIAKLPPHEGLARVRELAAMRNGVKS